MTEEKPTIRQWLTDNKDNYKHRELWIDDCAKELNVAHRSVREKANKIWPASPVANSPKPKTGLNRIDFMAKYDETTRIRNAIRSGIAELEKSDNPENDPIPQDTEFRVNICNYNSGVGWRPVADEEEFKSYQFAIGQKYFWSTRRTVDWAIENVSKARRL